MHEHFDAVIVGSGFGGSVMAYRLAQAGFRVCVLERGKPYPPNSFARTARQLHENFWDPSAQRYGLFSFWSFRHAGALVSSGLGGGSLIYANVLIRKDEKWFDETWPVTRRELDPHYDSVERMLNAQPYPFDRAPYSRTGKTQALRDAAAMVPGATWHLPNLAVSFRARPYDPENPGDPANPAVPGLQIVEDGGNLHGLPRSTCRLCGECDIGCNYGSKNTLDFNYLTAARNAGADIRTLHEVKSFRKESGRFQIEYVQHDLERRSSESPMHAMTADRLVLAAGTFGTTYLLLKNMPNLSPMLGRRYSGNGDLLSFIRDIHHDRERKRPRDVNPANGPVITSALRMGDSLDGDGSTGRGFYIEDGGFPAALTLLAELADVCGSLKRGLHFAKRLVRNLWGGNADADLGAELADLIGASTASNSMFPFLAMGRDMPSGRITLVDGRLQCDWRIDQSEQYYRRVEETGEKIAAALNARYTVNPAFSAFRQVVTAHPLGGCAMGRTANEGVVDPHGEAFGCEGLYVADGSVMPGPVGPNPALTIAALADRFADRIVEKKGVS